MRKVQNKQKFKNILANPFELKCPPSLAENEMQTLKNTLLNSNGKIEIGNCLSNKKIQLGLESTLRAINNCQVSCVFLSLRIKPAYIINLIVRNANVRDTSTLIYAQPNLEEFTQQIFGIKAMAMTLPKNLKVISEDLLYWMERKTNSTISTSSEISTKPCSKDGKSLHNLNVDTTFQLNSSSATVNAKEKIISLNAPLNNLIAFDKNDADSSSTKREMPICDISKATDFIPLDMTSEIKNCSNDIIQIPKRQKFKGSYDGSNNMPKSKASISEYQSLIVKKIKPNHKICKTTKYKK